jgi:hypothetical protein
MKQLTPLPHLLLVTSTLLLTAQAKLFESKSRKAARLALETARLEKERLRGLYIVFGRWEFDKTGFYTVVSVGVVILIAVGVQCGIWWRRRREETTDKAVKKAVDVVIVGNLLPRSGTGWFHLTQFLDVPNVRVRAVVETRLLDKSAASYRPPVAFVDLIKALLDLGVECVDSVHKLQGVLYNDGQRPKATNLLCVVAGKTEENPRYFRECINLGATHIYLEPPGATSAMQLKDMASLAEMRGVQVYMGYQKLCSAYIQHAVEFSRTIPKSHVVSTFVRHSNDK